MSTPRRESRSSESSSIQDLLQNVEANDLNNDDVHEDVALNLSSPSSPDGDLIQMETPKTHLRQRLKKLKLFNDTNESESELEDSSNNVVRKPSRISYDERLTVICDTETSTPLNTPPPSNSATKFDDVYQPFNLFSFIWEEHTRRRGYSADKDRVKFSEKRRKIYAFLRIPLELEQFLLYGLLQCVDAFLYLFTSLPLQLFMACIGKIFRGRKWTSADTCDVLKVIIIICGSILIREIDLSVIYHQVRSQGVIKLYIFYNMLEVADRLFSSLGQDIFDALFWTANSDQITPGNSVRIVAHLAVAIGYATLHSFLVILQATTLNVAFNSHNQTVLAIMMSNNFVELKGAVFKKFAKANLFQMACSDVRERFHIFALLFVVMIRNMTAMNWSVESFSEMVPDIIMVVGAEYFVDWLKHAFITKFNEINSAVYKDFTITIAFDVIRSRDQTSFSDYSDQVSRRMGFIPIPLSIMIIRVLSQTFSIENRGSLLICFIGWLAVFMLKICNSVIMLGKACQHVKQFRDLQARAESNEFRKRMLSKKSRSAPNSPRVSLIDFTDVLHQPAAGKGFTLSDISQWDELQSPMVVESRVSVDRETQRNEERTVHRRAKSMANIPRRDLSEPPPSTDDTPNGDGSINGLSSSTNNPSAVKVGDEPISNNSDSGQLSPKKKTVNEGDEELADVTAYKMPEQGVQRIE